VASGKTAQQFDVTLSQLATAVYGTRGPPPEGWTAVTDQQLIDRGVQDPQAWRSTFLGADEGNPQQFRAEIYTDGEDNYVLSYRGTAEGAQDWGNNFSQGAGFETNPGQQDGSTDKFSVTAVNTAKEFAKVFGDNPGGESSNLAITGHSQGGGLASVGSLASGVPAVTFDASGIHPNTLDRMGLDPQAARTTAEGGQIRAISTSTDALTRAQDSWVTGLVAPDALGTQIVVDLASADRNQMFSKYGPIEKIANSGLINTAVELARNPLTAVLSAPVGAALGGLLGGPGGSMLGAVAAPGLTAAGGNLAYAAISHSPNAMTSALIDQQPWQPGYENPTSIGRELQNLLPDTVKDDYARNGNDFINDVKELASTRFANGDYVQGGASLVGDLGEGFARSAGDTVDGYADQLAAGAKNLLGGGLVGSAASTVIDRSGDVLEAGVDLVGQGVETVADGAGWVGQRASDLVGQGVKTVADGAGWVGQRVSDLGNWVFGR